MSGPVVVLDVDGWGAVTVRLRKGKSELWITNFYSTMPSPTYLEDARKWARRFRDLTGIGYRVERRLYGNP